MSKQYSYEREKEISSYWESIRLTEKITQKNSAGKDFYFLQGPPYTSGKIHCGQAWNHALKDAVLRYKRMTGHAVLARAGYDMHGLPTELKVQDKFGLSGKDDIKTFGFERFTQECIAWSEEKSDAMTKDLKHLGITLDFTDPYKPISSEYVDSIWFLIKETDKKNRLYLGEKTMLWCPVTESALAKHEIMYKEIKDTSVFLKFQKKDTQNEYFIIWTTTPWTIPFNLAIMVNPSMEYVKAKVTYEETGKEEFFILCKDLAGIFLNNLDSISHEIVETFLGETLKGEKYIHPWAKDNPDIKDIKSESLFSILLSTEYVDSSAGTGLVHCAPGCGPEDYIVGLQNGLLPYNCIDEKGMFPERLLKFKGLFAKKDDKAFIQLMKEDGFLVKTSQIEHEYPFSERANVPVIFRTTKQWFFKVEDLKEQMLSANKSVYWHPESAKNAFNSWLDNLRDNSITKQRFWGTPAPIWADFDENGNLLEYVVVGSRKELESLATSPLPKDLHKPFIDNVTIKSPHTGKILTRIPDVLDVWIDAGCASFASLYYPQRTDLFEKYFPADFIVEGKDQIRGWFNLLMVASILAFDKPCFKNVSMHGFISGVDGVKMSKSLGNIITPEEIIEKSSIDTFRTYFTSSKAGEDIAFSWENISLVYRQLVILQNTVTYLINTSLGKTLPSKDGLEYDVEERYILSKVNSVVKEVSTLYESYRIDEIPVKIIDVILQVSREYIQIIRDKENKAVVLRTLHDALYKLLQIFAPIAPHITDILYNELRTINPLLTEESIHLTTFPQADESLIDTSLEKEFSLVLDLISSILSAREKAKINVRQPLQSVVVVTKNPSLTSLCKSYEAIIKKQTNIKEIILVSDHDSLVYTIKPKFKEIGLDFGEKTSEIAMNLKQLSSSETKDFFVNLHSSDAVAFKEYTLSKKHVDFVITTKEPFVLSTIQKDVLLLDTTLSNELLEEGLSREFIRRVQNERKDQNLTKDVIVSLYIDDASFLESISSYKELILKTCGLKEIVVLDSFEGTSLSLKDKTIKIAIKKD